MNTHQLFSRFTPICLFVLFSALGIAQELKSPAEFLGYEPGTRFTRHYRVVEYYRHLAKAAPDMIKLQTYGETNERRELILCFISSSANINNLESIRTGHLKSLEGKTDNDTAIVWLSYNVHGNESVSTEASMQTAYDLITKKRELLDNTVVILDPCVNPDGRDRYVNWYYQNVNYPHNVNPDSREHHEPWLNGRPNHYMFDLNRDWAWLTQKESRQRVAVFNQWLPHVHADFHEQGVDAPYYFAPGAEPLHEVITDWQKDFQVMIGKNHATYFDTEGWLYFTKEVFDLLYPSYGDTYPMYNGSIGMTYEQGGSGRAGLGIITSNKDTLTLRDRLAHHYTTGISTVEISSENAGKLNEEFEKFYARRNYKYRNYVLNGNRDHIHSLTRLLDRHNIWYHYTAQTTVKGFDYATGKQGSLKTKEGDLVVPSDQPKSTLVKVLFEPRTKLNDSLTYDITAWALPYAYGLDAIATESSTVSHGNKTAGTETPSFSPDPVAYAYVSNWNSMEDARFLTALLKTGIRIRYSEEPFTVAGKDFKRGSLIIARTDNARDKDFFRKLTSVANKYDRELTATSTGFVTKGKDFGSSHVRPVPEVKAALLSGPPASTLNVGEIWHFFEQQLGYPLTLVDTDYFDRTNLSTYNVLILPEGNYAEYIDEAKIKRLKEWVKNGGKLIAIGHALHAIKEEKDFGLKEKEAKEDDSVFIPVPYHSWERNHVKNNITGAIYKVKTDPTHPLAFGYPDTYFSLKQNSSAFDLLESGNAFYLKENGAPLSGFAGSEAQKNIANTLVFGVHPYGKGNMIYLVDNPLFRGFWENGKLLFVNALFMVQ
ncbi:zinc carboxypeptidase [Sinomicrobium pectinilyticum]|uniref:Zinc carboxypeptidase n=1 Tax=Sinomicrobium pectinilyticum TaxID=1084421 RepID=A0A3N0DJG7_SINP1|nr:M14 family metallopeptidase [Sinomicrobium pectinilyticum]RNL75566.1 zinc carboxypeptidase [Sinomicrobium pectinilyticum]